MFNIHTQIEEWTNITPKSKIDAKIETNPRVGIVLVEEVEQVANFAE